MPAPDRSAKASLSRDIARLTSALSLEEKAALTVGIDNWRTANIPRVGIPSVRVTDGPNGARGDTVGHVSITPSVCIPSASSLGATWDPAVVARASAIVARQALEKGCRVLLAPTVNLHRHPLWGRNFECFSEDPVLTGKLAVAYIGGVQNSGVAATIKHFVGNEVEHERNTSSSEIDERALRELYLLPFEYGVRIAGVLAVMTSYNRVNGRFVPDDLRLLDGILRKEWGFAGFVMTDWSGIAGTIEAATAGLDLEMPAPARAFGPALVDAVRSGQLDETRLDEMAHRMLTVFDAIGALDDVPVGEHPEDREEDRAFVRRAAADGIVLLTNDGLLPLQIPRLGRVAVVGPNAERLAIMGGGSATVLPHYVLSPLTVLRERLAGAAEIVYAPGVASDGVADEASIEAAVSAVEGADAVILIVGTDEVWESEGYDRESMELPRNQDELVRRVLSASPRGVVVVNSGSPIDLSWADRAAAVIQTWFGGQELANAIVDVLLGDSEPGGRLPTTLPICIEHTPAFGSFPGESSTVRYSESLLVGYRLVRDAPAAGAIRVRPRTVVHDLRDRRTKPVRFDAGAGWQHEHRGSGDQHRSAPRRRGRPALCRTTRRRTLPARWSLPPCQGTAGLRQGVARPGRDNGGVARAQRAIVRLLRHRRHRLAIAPSPDACHGLPPRPGAAFASPVPAGLVRRLRHLQALHRTLVCRHRPRGRGRSDWRRLAPARLDTAAVMLRRGPVCRSRGRLLVPGRASPAGQIPNCRVSMRPAPIHA